MVDLKKSFKVILLCNIGRSFLDPSIPPEKSTRMKMYDGVEYEKCLSIFIALIYFMFHLCILSHPVHANLPFSLSWEAMNT